MQLQSGAVALPFEFTKEEAEAIATTVGRPLIQAYLQSLLHRVAELHIMPDDSTSEEIVRNNAYMAGQTHVLESLLSDEIYIPTYTPEETNNAI